MVDLRTIADGYRACLFPGLSIMCFYVTCVMFRYQSYLVHDSVVDRWDGEEVEDLMAGEGSPDDTEV